MELNNFNVLLIVCFIVFAIVTIWGFTQTILPRKN